MANYQSNSYRKSTFKTVLAFLLAIVLTAGATVGGIYLVKALKAEKEVLTVIKDNTKIKDGDGGITVASGDKIYISGVEDYSVAVYAYTEKAESETDFYVGHSSYIIRWSEYQKTGVYPWSDSTVTVKDFLKYDKSGLTLDKQTEYFTLTYTGFKDILGDSSFTQLYWSEGETALKDRVTCDKFRIEVSSEKQSVSFTFNIDEDFTALSAAS